MPTDNYMEAAKLARQFHETYERLAPSFGYETREDTKQFDPESKNGRLMVAVCGEIVSGGVQSFFAAGFQAGIREGAGPISPQVGGWIAFSDRMPEPAHDPKNPGQPTHGYILVTNNLEARNRWGKMSHVWLVSMVHIHEQEIVFGGMEMAAAGEITAFAEPHGNRSLRGLTHWRPAVVEEW